MKQSKYFDNGALLDSIDTILPLSSHYNEILSLHLNALKNCAFVADLACGTGILVLEFLKKSKKVFAIDLSSKSLDKLSEKAYEFDLVKNLVVLEKDATKLEGIQDNYFDGVSSMIAAHLFVDFEAHLEESFRILRKGGVFVLTARSDKKNQEHLVEVVRNSLLKKGVFSDYTEVFENLRDNLLLTANERSNHLLSAEKVKRLLQNIGFQCIEIKENGTAGVMYTLVSKKI